MCTPTSFGDYLPWQERNPKWLQAIFEVSKSDTSNHVGLNSEPSSDCASMEFNIRCGSMVERMRLEKTFPTVQESLQSELCRESYGCLFVCA